MTKNDWGPMKIDIREKLHALGVKPTPEIKRQIGDLTFDECEVFAGELSDATSAQAAFSVLTAHWNTCTLQTPVSKDENRTWAERCKAESIHNR